MSEILCILHFFHNFDIRYLFFLGDNLMLGDTNNICIEISYERFATGGMKPKL